jgi:tetratricopeptide (TPR) repeat protein
MAIKETLRGLVEACRERETADLVPHVEEPPASRGAWSPKDNLAHLSAWRLIAAEELDAVRRGGSGPELTDELDAHNAKIYDEHRDLAPAKVLERASASWAELLAALGACSEEDLQKPRLHRTKQEVWQVVAGNTYFHLAQHLDWWHSERGEHAAAEDAAVWAHDLAVGAFPEGGRRAVAEYNLGCYYASHSRADEAVPFIRRSLELYPDLLDLAREDSDLDPIRELPEVVKLLA